jgi:hypothetical protein
MMGMKKTLIIAGLGAAAGYFLGTATGRAKLEEFKRRAQAVASDPDVQQKVSDIAGQVKDQAGRRPDPVAGVVRTAADQLQTKLNHHEVA